jgi:hypothetical protein
MKTIEGFAVECSINKVWTSEALAWAVDEAVQVFGGNGYSREFPVERMYRDARITRIYEGTNEINRMLVPMRLLRQLPEVFSVQEARRGLARVEREASAERAFAAEHEVISLARALAVALLAESSASYGAALKDAQEIQAQIADMLIEIYASGSALARAEKLAGDRRGPIAADIVRVYVDGASGRLATAAKAVIAALADRGVATGDLVEAARGLAPYPGIDAIAARRRIADAMIQAEKFPF